MSRRSRTSCSITFACITNLILQSCGSSSKTDSEQPAQNTTLNYAAISPLLQANCVGCHSSSVAQGNIVLSSFEDVKENSKSIKAVLESNRMPKNNSSWSASEDSKKVIRWIDGGTAQ